LKDEHASLVNEKIVNPTIEPHKENPPIYDSNWMDFASCETYPSLYEKIKSLTKKLEKKVSKGSMVFAMNSKDERTPLKGHTKNTLMIKTTKSVENLMDLTLGAIIVEDVVIPHLIATLA